MAKIVSPTQENISKAVGSLKAGNLVSFPTETVYGLGANVLDEAAVRKIFETKKRPLSDPLIVHVAEIDVARSLCNMDSTLDKIFTLLAERFWPGPLTLVVPAADHVPRVALAGGSTVGLRCPAHPVALALLASGIPVAAPSANLFGHVSPTTAQHVVDDFRTDPVLVLDGGACQVGIESTVVTLAASSVAVLRRGAVSATQLASCLAAGGMGHVAVSTRTVYLSPTSEAAAPAPGQLLTHYAPNVPCHLAGGVTSAAEHLQPAAAGAEAKRWPLARVCVLDVGGVLALHYARAVNACRCRTPQGVSSSLPDACAAYADLSAAGVASEAAQRLFERLRWAETVPGVALVVVADIRQLQEKEDDAREGESGVEVAAVFDRMFRATSGLKADIIVADAGPFVSL